MVPSRTIGPIFVAAFGTSTPFAYWGFGLLCGLVEYAVGAPIHRIHGGTLATLRDGWLERDGKSVVLTTDLPEAALTAFLAANPVQTIVFLDTPRDAILSAYASRGQSLEEATRLSVQTFSAMAEPFCDARALIIRRWRYRTPEDIVADVLSYLRSEPTTATDVQEAIELTFGERASDLLHGTLEEALLAGDIRGPFFAGQDVSLSPEEDRLVETIARSYMPLFEGRRPNEIVWPTELFFTGDRRPILSAVEMAGSLGIFWGPYFNLPRGSWEAHVTFEIIDNYNPDPASVDVRVGGEYVQRTLTLPKQGIFSYALPFAVADPNDRVEVRLILSRGSIEGRFLLRRVSFKSVTAQAETASAAPDPAMIAQHS